MVSSTNPDISVLVVSYNTQALTLASLQSLMTASPDLALQVVVVDNASSDGSAEAVKEAFPSVELIQLSENVGFARANNIAAKHARAEKILLLNPDTLVLNGAISQILDFSERRPDAGIWGGRTYGDVECTFLNLGSCWGLPTFWSLFCETFGLNALFPESNLFNSEHYGSWQRDQEREVGMVAGCFLLITRDLWNRLDGFDDGYFMYFEDTDLNIRARALGYRPAITPRATIVHLGGASEPDQAEKLDRFLRSKVRLIRTHWNPVSAKLGTTLVRLRTLVRSVAYGVASRFRPERFATPARTWLALWRRTGSWS